MYEFYFDDVRFVEGLPPNAEILRPIRIEIGGVFRSAQLRNLDDVKRLMAREVIAAGGNAVVNFKYGQRSVGFLASLFQRDDVNWYGSGAIASIQRPSGRQKMLN